MELLNVVVLAVLCASAVANVVNFEPCNDDRNACHVSEVRASSSKGRMAEFKKGHNSTLSFDFTPSFSASNLRTTIYYIHYNIAVDLTNIVLRPKDGDASSNVTGPIEANLQQTFNYDLYLSKRLPNRLFLIKWKISNRENESEMCCFTTTIKLTSDWELAATN